MTTDQLPIDRRRAVEPFVVDWLSDHRIPGAAIAVVDRVDLVYAEGFGARTLEDNDPATPDRLFGVGSCTKSFTATAIMQLLERGAIALEDRVDDYVPHLPDAPGAPVTIEELLTHTSGMPSDGSAGPLITRSLGLGHVEVPLSSEANFRRHVQGSADRRVTDRDAFFYYLYSGAKAPSSTSERSERVGRDTAPSSSFFRAILPARRPTLSVYLWISTS